MDVSVTDGPAPHPAAGSSKKSERSLALNSTTGSELNDPADADSKAGAGKPEVHRFGELERQHSVLEASQGHGDANHREFTIAHPSWPHGVYPFEANAIKTSKYTAYNFIFVNLAEQFTRLANFYFLVVAVLMFIPGVSPLTPWTSVAPLVFVLSVSAIKEALEDWGRHKNDATLNALPCNRYNHERAEFETVPWESLHVGDVIRVVDHETFPADVILLASAQPEGTAYVETSNLDGETSLKTYGALPVTQDVLVGKAGAPEDQPERDYADQVPNITSYRINSQGPSLLLYEYSGNLDTNNNQGRPAANGAPSDPNSPSLVPIDAKQLLLRGSELRNTGWALGVVVFTGHETRIMMNANTSRVKNATVDRFLNQVIWGVFGALVLMSVFSAILFGVWIENNKDDAWYLRYELSPPDVPEDATFAFLTFFILYSNLIPISLYVSIEVVKVAQALLIDFDPKMKDDHPDRRGAKSRTSNLSDELGEVRYIFSDKTGTLTRNVMMFKTCSIAGIEYGSHAPMDARRQSLAVSGSIREEDVDMEALDIADHVEMSEEEGEEGSGHGLRHFSDPRLMARLRLASEAGSSREVSPEHQASEDHHMFMRVLALCNTVLPHGDPGSPSEIVYHATSPDEAALADAARYFGYTFLSRSLDHVMLGVDSSSGSDSVAREAGSATVAMGGDSGMMLQKQKWETLTTLEFNSVRKRMSVIVRGPDGKLLLLCKGADDVIFERLADEAENESRMKVTKEHLHDFSSLGLRTLVLAYRVVGESEFAEWNVKWQDAANELNDREGVYQALAEELEKGLTLLGATGVEDKLQAGVPECIGRLRRAGIMVWVLTGDKRETAINIGYSSNLLDQSMDVINLKAKSSSRAKEQITEALGQIKAQQDVTKKRGLVVDGTTLDVLYRSDLLTILLELASHCESVICCRATPLQKAQLVRLVKETYGVVTLSIGDGANDVSMIKEAHIGIGISGKEGRQAVLASDYAISQFRFLQRLVLVHGRYSAIRIRQLVLYSFYKNYAYIWPLLWFSIYTGWSGQALHDDVHFSLFNTLFTVAPTMILAVFDKDVPTAAMYEFPELYRNRQLTKTLTWGSFSRYLLRGIFHSILLLFVPVLAIATPAAIVPSGFAGVGGLRALGTVVYTVLLFVVTAQLYMMTWEHNRLDVFFSVLSLLVWFIFEAIFTNLEDFFTSPRHFGLFQQLFGSGPFWFVIPITVLLCVGPELIVLAYMRVWRPSQTTIVQELYQLKVKSKAVQPSASQEKTGKA